MHIFYLAAGLVIGCAGTAYTQQSVTSSPYKFIDTMSFMIVGGRDDNGAQHMLKVDAAGFVFAYCQ